MDAVHCWNSSSSALSALDDIQSFEGANLQTCCRLHYPSYITCIASNRCLECCVQGAQKSRTREGKKALNLGFICRLQTR